MKHFLINLLVVLLISGLSLILASLNEVRVLRKADFFLGDDVHIIAIGPSTITASLIDDSIPGFRNMSRAGTAYNALVPILPKILDENPQIDTVWINHGRFMTMPIMEGNSVNVSFQSTRDLVPFYLYDLKMTQWQDLIRNMDFYGALLNPDIYNYCVFDRSKPSGYGFIGFKSGDFNDLNDSTSSTGIVAYNNILKGHGSNIYTKEWIVNHCATTHKYVNKAIEICESRGVTVILFFTPLYQFERWCTLDGYCDYMKNMNPDLLIADYEDFVFPDDSYYGDVHHLNCKGAEYFSGHIALHGLNIVNLNNWLQSKNNYSRIDSCQANIKYGLLY